MSKLIQDRQLTELAEQGFTVLESLFAVQEMGELGKLIEAHQRRHVESLKAQGGTDGGISRAEEITFTDHLAEADAEIMRFVSRPEFVDVCTSLLGPDVDLYWNQSVYKAGKGTKEFPWHQDDGYMEVTPAPYLTIWLAINDVTVENGCVWFLPGSHKGGVMPHEDTPIGKACYSLDAPDQGVPAPLAAGSAAVFWSQTMHKSGLNVSDKMRKAFVIQYSAAGLRYAHNQELVPGLTPIARNGNPV
jgi:ectoine hydroxylase-related dioxygenase (phytanoyl-CoA dioxygenase family)